MAVKINTYEQRTAPSNAGPLPQARGIEVASIGGALQRLGGAIGQAGETAAAVDVREKNKRAEEDAKAYTIGALGKLHADSATHYSNLQKNVKPGAEGFRHDFNTWADDYTKIMIENAPTEMARSYLRERAQTIREHYDLKALDFEDAEHQRWRATTIYDGINNLAKYVEQNPTDIKVVIAEQRAVLDRMEMLPEQRRKLEDYLYTTVAAAKYKGDFERALKAGQGRKYLEDFESSQDPYLTVEQKGALGGQFYTKLARFEKMHKVDTTQAEATVGWAVDQLDKGYTPDQKLVEGALSQLPPDNPKRQKYEMAVQSQAQAVNFQQAPLDVQQHAITEIESNLRKGQVLPGQVELLERYKKIHADSEKSLTDDPFEFAQRSGVIPVQKPIFTEQGLDASAVLERKQAAEKVSAYNGDIPVSITTKSERAGLNRTLNSMAPQAKHDALIGLAKTGGEQAVIDVIKGSDDPLLPSIAIAAIRKRKTESGQDVSMLMMVGQEALNPREVDGKKPPPRLKLEDREDKGITYRFTKKVGNAFAGNSKAFGQARDAVTAIYAGLAVEAGNYDKEPDPKLFNQAMEAYFGKEGIVKWRGGNEVIAPVGMDSGDFEDSIHGGIRTQTVAAGYDRVRVEAITKRGVPRNKGDGTYSIMFDGEIVRDLRTGQDLIVDVRPAPVSAAQPQALPQTQFETDTDGLVELGNVNLYDRPAVQNADGSVSSVRSMSFQEEKGGPEILVPTVSEDGRIMSDKEAIEQYKKTGRHLGKFETPDEATAYAKRLHEQQAKLIKPVSNLETMPVEKRRKLAYNAPELDAYATQMEQKYKLPEGIINAIKNAGEKSNSNQTSKAGAKGVMQFMPQNLAKYGVHDPTDPVQMIEAAARYLKDTSRQYNGNVAAMIADYNGGPRQAREVLKGKPPKAKETHDYLMRVQRWLASKGRDIPPVTATAGIRG